MQSRFYAAGRQDLWLLQKAAAARMVYALYSMHGVRLYGMPCTWCMHVRHVLYMVYACTACIVHGVCIVGNRHNEDLDKLGDHLQ